MEGVTLIQRARIKWKPISFRIITARFQSKPPIKESTSKKEKDILLPMGVMNTKVGNNNNGYEVAI